MRDESIVVPVALIESMEKGLGQVEALQHAAQEVVAKVPQLLEAVEDLRQQLDDTRQAGQELATALWALVLAQQPSMADGLPAAIAHAEELVKKYTSEEDRQRLSFALMRAKAGLGAEGMRA